MVAEIYIGTSGWSYEDWRGIVYPKSPPKGFRELAYYAEIFDAVEINTTFYRPPLPQYCEKWLDDVDPNPRFKFTLKLWQRFTHTRDTKWTEEEAGTFKAGIEPLAEAGRLGAVLIQFPWSFRNSQSSRGWLANLAETFAEYPLVLEVRHASWNNRASLEFMRSLNLNFCNIDQPVTKSSIPPTSIATGPIAYYRFHGRNYRNWFKKDAGRDARYDYLYTPEELQPWIENIEEMEKRVEQIYVMTNNHYRGQAPVNALQMRSALKGTAARVPPSLVERYPDLGGVRRTLRNSASMRSPDSTISSS